MGFISEEQEKQNADKIAKAIDFATKQHGSVINKDGSIGQKRKGSSLPYIVHPLEVWLILRNNNCSLNAQIAGLLHDTLEDTGTTPQEIEKEFGKDILDLVLNESEDKSKTWEERKQATIDHLAKAPLEVQQVCCADKLSNSRAQLYDYNQIGDDLWKRFKVQKDKQSWYYREIVKALSPLKDFKMYQELKDIVEKIYGK